MDRVLSAAGAALGVELTGVRELSRGRSLVLRALAGDRPVVVKAPLETGPGPARELAALRVLGGVVPPDTSADALASAAEALAPLLPQLGVRPSAAALDELRGLRVGGPTALTPGDACPDNNVRTQDGYVLIDFEWAEFRPVAWDAAYLRVPWPTCWCSWALPDEVVERALDRWRAVIGPLPPDFDAELDRATLAWTFISTGFFLPRILDGTDHVQNRAGPVRRAFLHHWLRTAPGDGPLADLAAETLAALVRTQDAHPLDLAPAFR